MKKIELSAKSLASLDLAIKQKKENFDITGDDVCEYIQVTVDVTEVLTEILAADPLSEKLLHAITGVFKQASVDDLIKIRERAVQKKYAYQIQMTLNRYLYLDLFEIF